MSTASLALTTSLQDVSSFSGQRQIGVSGGSSNLIVDIYISDDVSHDTTIVRVVRVNGPSSLVPLVDSSPAMKYVVVQGSIEDGGVWLQGPTPFASTAVDVLTTATNVDAIGLSRQLAWVGASADFVATVFALESSLLAPIQTIDGPNGYAQLPNDVTASAKYVVTRGSIQGGKIWMQGTAASPS